MPRLAGFPTDATIRFDGASIPARRGEPVAAALLAADRPLVSRSAKYHRPRGPFCLADSCAGCFVRSDGLPNRRACRIACRDGLEIESQNAFPGARHDLLGAVDLATPRGLDHHRLATWSLLANRIAVALARRLSGVGRLPSAATLHAARPPPREERFDALVVGAGPAGLAAAEALADAGRRVVVADEAPAAGGRLRARLGAPGDPDLAWAGAVVRRVSAAGGEVATGTCVAGLWHDGGEPLALLDVDGRLRLVRARAIVLAPGGHPQPLAAPGGDRPGILAGRGVAILLAEHGVVPGARAAIVGEGEDAERLALTLARAGMEVTRAPSAEGGALAGRSRVRALALPSRRIACDTLVVATPPAPAFELGRALGAAVRWDAALGALSLAAEEDGRTGVPGLYAAGEVTGAAGTARAAEAGRRAGEAARG